MAWQHQSLAVTVSLCEGGAPPRYTLADEDLLLAETGDYIMTETNDYTELE